MISTHILSQRMTMLTPEYLYRITISTHILSQRMTAIVSGYMIRDFHFDSHPLTEDDTDEMGNIDTWIDFDSHPLTEDDEVAALTITLASGISTHILSQRMTQDGYYWDSWNSDFDSHPLTEDDRCLAYNPLGRSISTHILSQRMTKRQSI